MKLDKIHWNSRAIDGHNKQYRFIIGAREGGKSTNIILKMYRTFKETGRYILILRRQQVAITDLYIKSIQNTINKFHTHHVTLTYKTSSLGDGIVPVYIKDKLFMLVLGMSVNIDRIKSSCVPNLAFGVFDEFIVNKTFGERYLKNEYNKFREIEKTFNRECKGVLIWYFLGNPYSLYNPYFVHHLGDKINDLKMGEIYDGVNFSIEWYKLSDELVKYILEKNPDYEFEDDYSRYALQGYNVNDENIKIRTSKPNNYFIEFCFRIAGKTLAVYKNTNYDEENLYYVEPLKENIVNKRIYAFDFENLVDRTTLLNRDDLFRFRRFSIAIQQRRIEFNTYECYYLVEEIYKVI